MYTLLFLQWIAYKCSYCSLGSNRVKYWLINNPKNSPYKTNKQNPNQTKTQRNPQPLGCKIRIYWGEIWKLPAVLFTACVSFTRNRGGEQNYLHVLHHAAVLKGRWTSRCIICCGWNMEWVNLCLIHWYMNKSTLEDDLAHIWAVSITEVPSVQKLISNFECLFGISVELHEHKCFKTLLGVQEPSL